MRRRMGRPGLVGTMARTAVVAGTATAVAGGVHNRQMAKQQAAVDAQTNDAEMAAMQAQQPPPPPAAGGGDLMAELQRLADMHASGILDDAEFAAAKAKLLA